MKREGSIASRVALATCAIALAVLAAVGGFVAMAAELTFDLTIEHGRVAGTMRLIRVHEGDVVRLRWTTDRPLDLHLHGYNIERHIEPGAATELRFTAYATGRFPIHVHVQAERGGGQPHEGTPLIDVEVYPR